MKNNFINHPFIHQSFHPFIYLSILSSVHLAILLLIHSYLKKVNAFRSVVTEKVVSNLIIHLSNIHLSVHLFFYSSFWTFIYQSVHSSTPPRARSLEWMSSERRSAWSWREISSFIYPLICSSVHPFICPSIYKQTPPRSMGWMRSEWRCTCSWRAIPPSIRSLLHLHLRPERPSWLSTFEMRPSRIGQMHSSIQRQMLPRMRIWLQCKLESFLTLDGYQSPGPLSYIRRGMLIAKKSCCQRKTVKTAFKSRWKTNLVEKSWTRLRFAVDR